MKTGRCEREMKKEDILKIKYEKRKGKKMQRTHEALILTHRQWRKMSFSGGGGG
jgi:hypothetical protein